MLSATEDDIGVHCVAPENEPGPHPPADGIRITDFLVLLVAILALDNRPRREVGKERHTVTELSRRPLLWATDELEGHASSRR